ncbi:hypothetical protein X559_1270 [Paenilisteria newyorkensis]|nr:hypothetical protein X559_1270 [Listeria newyorkensis]
MIIVIGMKNTIAVKIMSPNEKAIILFPLFKKGLQGKTMTSL